MVFFTGNLIRELVAEVRDPAKIGSDKYYERRSFNRKFRLGAAGIDTVVLLAVGIVALAGPHLTSGLLGSVTIPPNVMEIIKWVALGQLGLIAIVTIPKTVIDVCRIGNKKARSATY